MPGGCLTALFSADAGDDDASNTLLPQPDIKAATDQRAVSTLAE